MATETELAYCAGVIDGEGCIRIKRSEPYRHLTGRVNPAYHASVQVRMTHQPVIRYLTEILGGWDWAEKSGHAGRKPLYTWQVSDNAADAVIRAVRPYLRVKAAQADNVLALRALQKEKAKHRTKITGYRNFPNKYGTIRMVPNMAYSDEFIACCETLYERSRELNKVGA